MKAASKGTQIATQFVSAIASGSSAGVSASVSGKIFSNIKYLNISYSYQLEQALQTWKSSYLSLGFNSEVPDGVQAELGEGASPYVFEKYGVSSTFLINLWEPFLLLILLITIFGLIRILEWIIAIKNKASTYYRVLLKSRIFLFNFLLTQIYNVYGDVALFAILEFRSLDLSANLACLSFIVSLVLFVLMAFGLFYHVWFLHQYQTLKKGSSDQELQQFKSDNPGWEVLYQDFKDQNLLKQSFLFILTIRDIAFSILLVTLFEHPLTQCIMILILSVMMLSYMLITRPFASIWGQVQQIFFEFVIFVVSLSTLVLAVMDRKDSTETNSKQRIGKLLIIVNMIFNFSALGFMIVQLFLQGKEFYQHYRAKKTYPQRKKTRLDSTFTNPTIQHGKLNQDDPMKESQLNLQMDSFSVSRINDTQKNIYSESYHPHNTNRLDSQNNVSKIVHFKPIENSKFSTIQAPNIFERKRAVVRGNMTREEQTQKLNIISNSLDNDFFYISEDYKNRESLKKRQIKNSSTSRRVAPAGAHQNFQMRLPYQETNNNGDSNSQAAMVSFHREPNARRRNNI